MIKSGILVLVVGVHGSVCTQSVCTLGYIYIYIYSLKYSNVHSHLLYQLGEEVQASQNFLFRSCFSSCKVVKFKVVVEIVAALFAVELGGVFGSCCLLEA